jgi:hypothetical protein
MAALYKWSGVAVKISNSSIDEGWITPCSRSRLICSRKKLLEGGANLYGADLTGLVSEAEYGARVGK